MPRFSLSKPTILHQLPTQPPFQPHPSPQTRSHTLDLLTITAKSIHPFIPSSSTQNLAPHIQQETFSQALRKVRDDMPSYVIFSIFFSHIY